MAADLYLLNCLAELTMYFYGNNIGIDLKVNE